jgi:hypothetical protein
LSDYFGDDYFAADYFGARYFGPQEGAPVPPVKIASQGGRAVRWLEGDALEEDEALIIALMSLR